MDMITSQVIQSAAGPVTSNAAYQQNRERVAALADLGYGFADFYELWQGPLFIAGVVGAVASGYALKKRKSIREANVLYALTGVGSLVLAWLTRPDFMRPAPLPTAAPLPEGGASASAKVLGWLDRRAAGLNASSPGWEAPALTRLANDLGGGTIDPAIKLLLTANTH